MEAINTAANTQNPEPSTPAPKPSALESFLFPNSEQRPPVVVTDADKLAFFKSFLADLPYTEKRSLLGGNFVVTLKSLSLPEAAAVQRQIKMDIDRGQIVDAAYVVTMRMYRLAAALQAIGDVPLTNEFVEGYPDDDLMGKTYVGRRAELISNWQEAKMAAVMEEHINFERKVIELSQRVQDPDFWKATA